MDDLQYYENPDTGAVFGFGEPLPEAIVDQIKARKLRRCDPPEDAVPVSPETDPEPKADGDDEDDGDTDTATGVEPEAKKQQHGGRRPR